MRHPARGSRREKLPLRREFVRERNGSKVIPVTHDSPMRIEIGYESVAGLCFSLVVRAACISDSTSTSQRKAL
jgi:hypothetical protein